jgi:hypothetical protein
LEDFGAGWIDGNARTRLLLVDTARGDTILNEEDPMDANEMPKGKSFGVVR